MNTDWKQRVAKSIRDRTAEIRDSWSDYERTRRFGLPPDLPWMLRKHLQGLQQSAQVPSRNVHMIVKADSTS